VLKEGKLAKEGPLQEELRIWTEKRDEKARDPKRRARDKVLRDPKTASVAMGVRKVWGFGGYAWRRGHWSGLNDDRGVDGDVACEEVSFDGIDGVD
jgi:hypothetical protein